MRRKLLQRRHVDSINKFNKLGFLHPVFRRKPGAKLKPFCRPGHRLWSHTLSV